jgi:hypothetical protein
MFTYPVPYLAVEVDPFIFNKAEVSDMSWLITCQLTGYLHRRWKKKKNYLMEKRTGADS